ncbi:FliH/SctL family protein [Burkholderia metallica]|uniref:Flagellar assembly protein FliH n=1 Tax=Burkholderia metallica TaxID=488729 RepID=A0ABT8PJ67_9BURK|nr:FliH/SctL family protein [Burkholderia metallica]MDN7934700.1 FliH/SctL family protein [Burkholderia metallica]
MRTYRKYAFPSLTRFRATREDGDRGDAPLPGLDDAPAIAQLDDARQAGYDDGYTAGMAAGRQEGAQLARRDAQAALDALAEPLDALVDGFDALAHAERGAMRDELVALVEKVARQVIRAELDMRPEQILAFVDEALASSAHASDTPEVRVSAADFARIEAGAPELAQRWNLTLDARLAPGECRVKAGAREVDAGCGQRLAACLERIAEHVGAAQRAADEGADR